MNTPTSTRMSSLPPAGNLNFSSFDKSPVDTPRRKARSSMLPSPSSAQPKGTSKSPSTPRTKKILQTSISASPNKLKKAMTPQRSQSKLKPPSSSLTPPTAPKTPKSPLSIGDRTVKVDNSLARTNSVTPAPKKTVRTPSDKVARKSTGSLLASNSFGSTGSKRHSLLSLSLSASSSREYNSDNEEAVKVCVRIRPVFDMTWDQRAYTTGPSDENIIVRTGLNNTDTNVYRFDNVYDEDVTTQHVYETSVQDIVESVTRQGRNGTVFTYGQTSTGKTYTMHGIISAAAKDIFNFLADEREKADGSSLMTCVKVSCMELYNEELRDLLEISRVSSSGLGIREDRRGNVHIPNLSERIVGSVEDLLAVLLEADTNRTVGSTAMNERSSRSHTIFRITYEKKEAKETRRGGAMKEQKSQSFDTSDSGDGVECTLSGHLGGDENEKITKKMVTTVSTLNLVDLAGSESVKHTGATGDRQKEGGRINQSLLTLSTVLVKLGNKDPGHINYRDSKLTRILKPSLSGNARMAAICCISPLVQFQDESKSTLDFASRTMLVTTNASKNETVEYDDEIVGQFEQEIERLKSETANAEKGQRQLAVSLQESTEQIVCLMASIEIEKNKVATLEKQNYDFMMQVEELTLMNEELKATEQKQSSSGDVALLKSMENLTLHNEHLEKRIQQLVEEKAQLEFRLMREMNKSEKRKGAALEKRKQFKSKLGDMKARLRDDITGAVSHPALQASTAR